MLPYTMGEVPDPAEPPENYEDNAPREINDDYTAGELLLKLVKIISWDLMHDERNPLFRIITNTTNGFGLEMTASKYKKPRAFLLVIQENEGIDEYVQISLKYSKGDKAMELVYSDEYCSPQHILDDVANVKEKIIEGITG